jgi:hypothetical protein
VGKGLLIDPLQTAGHRHPSLNCLEEISLFIPHYIGHSPCATHEAANRCATLAYLSRDTHKHRWSSVEHGRSTHPPRRRQTLSTLHNPLTMLNIQLQQPAPAQQASSAVLLLPRNPDSNRRLSREREPLGRRADPALRRARLLPRNLRHKPRNWDSLRGGKRSYRLPNLRHLRTNLNLNLERQTSISHPHKSNKLTSPAPPYTHKTPTAHPHPLLHPSPHS